MKIKKILCMALASSMIFSVPVFAAEENNVVSIENENADSILFEDMAAQEQIVSCDDFVSLDTYAERFDLESIPDDIVTLASTGDKYEPNNSVATATTGLMGKKVTATIHEGDVDWYKLEVYDTSQDVKAEKPIYFLNLMNW